MSDEQDQHVPVLLKEVGELLAVAPGDVVLDCTVGHGGHAGMLAESAGGSGLLIGMDVDEINLGTASQRLEGSVCPQRLIQCNFSRVDEVLKAERLDWVDVILADLGLSSSQLGDARRGFSFQFDGPLDMRMDGRLTETASDLINRLNERDLADLIYRYGQDRRSRQIARAIHRARHLGRVTTTGQLARVIASAVKVDPNARKSKIHPATRTFQALRIAVNDELGALEGLLRKAPGCLRSGGRIGVISFHSLEDGMVKRDFRQRQAEGSYVIRTKKPVTAGAVERSSNPRSRSAKLRVALRTDQPLDH